MSSQLQCGFIQVQVVSHLLLPGFRVSYTPSSQESGCKWNSFCDYIFVPKEGGTVTINTHVLLDGLWKIFMHYWLTFVNLKWYRPRSCNWGNPLWVLLWYTWPICAGTKRKLSSQKDKDSRETWLWFQESICILVPGQKFSTVLTKLFLCNLVTVSICFYSLGMMKRYYMLVPCQRLGGVNG